MAKVLFVGEAVALAHVSRPVVLAQAAQRAGFDVVVAMDPRSAWVAEGSGVRLVPVASMGPERFLAAIARGAPLFDRRTLREYVRADAALLAAERPDIVVGDLRLSLSASARTARVPYVAVCNAYWSPYAAPARYPVPPLAALRALPLPLAQAGFQVARRVAFEWHARPVNAVRRDAGLPPLRDVRHAYTDADHVAYADVPEVFHLRDAPPTHRFIGPVVWSPPVALPDWWPELAAAPIVYVTLGSSGDPGQLPQVLAGLASLGTQIVVATAGRRIEGAIPAGVRVADYLPGDVVAQRSTLVVCNGGAPTSQQALAAGVPVLGVASNMDQLLNMQAVEAFGAGLALRGDRLRAADVTRAAQRLLGEPAFGRSARTLAATFARYPAGERLVALLREIAR